MSNSTIDINPLDEYILSITSVSARVYTEFNRHSPLQREIAMNNVCTGLAAVSRMSLDDVGVINRAS